MERRRLSADEVAAALADLNGWTAADGHIEITKKFGDFASALEYVNRVGGLADAADHHPDITFGWGYARFVLTTHDRGGVTDVDIMLARQIDEL